FRRHLMLRILHSVGGKLYLVVGLLAGVAIIVGIIGLLKMAQINDQLNEIVEVTSTKQNLAGRATRALVSMHRAEKNFILSIDPKDMADYGAAIDRNRQTVEDILKEMTPLSNDENKRLIAEFQTILTKFVDIN